MNIGISMEMTRVLRDTWHAALNHEWYDFLAGHRITPLCCHGEPSVTGLDLVILAGGNDMPGIKTWRNNHYPDRDAFESILVRYALEAGIPVVGICRGSHFINVLQGGTVVLMDDPYDNVQVQLPQFDVTCHHTIRVQDLAPGFDILAQDHNGVIELAIDRQLRMLQVGWHPERAVNAHTRTHILQLIGQL